MVSINLDVRCKYDGRMIRTAPMCLLTSMTVRSSCSTLVSNVTPVSFLYCLLVQDIPYCTYAVEPADDDRGSVVFLWLWDTKSRPKGSDSRLEMFNIELETVDTMLEELDPVLEPPDPVIGRQRFLPALVAIAPKHLYIRADSTLLSAVNSHGRKLPRKSRDIRQSILCSLMLAGTS